MAQPEDAKRRVGTINGEAIDAVANAQHRMENALKALARPLGSADPVQYHKAHRDAQQEIVEAQAELRGALALLNSIAGIVALNLQRGPYKKTE